MPRLAKRLRSAGDVGPSHFHPAAAIDVAPPKRKLEDLVLAHTTDELSIAQLPRVTSEHVKRRKLDWPCLTGQLPASSEACSGPVGIWRDKTACENKELVSGILG